MLNQHPYVFDVSYKCCLSHFLGRWMQTYSILPWLLLNTSKPYPFYFQIVYLYPPSKGVQCTLNFNFLKAGRKAFIQGEEILIRKSTNIVPHKQYFSSWCSHNALGAEFLGKILSPMRKNERACPVTLQPAIDLNDSIILTTLFPSSSPQVLITIQQPCNKTLYLEPLPWVHTILQMCLCVSLQ